MIRLLVITLSMSGLMMISQNSVAQQVTFDDLTNSTKTATSSKSSSKKWIRDFNEAENGEVAKEVLTSELIKLEKSRHWVSLYANGEITKELSFQTSKKMYVDKVIKDLKEAGFVLSSTRITDEANTYVYTNGDLKVEVYALATETSAQQIYLVTLL